MPKIKTKREDVLREAEFQEMIDKLQGEEVIEGTYRLKKIDPNTGEQVVQRFNIECRKAECLLCLLWIFGRRISGILLLRRRDIWIDGHFLFVRFRVLKKHRKTAVVQRSVKKITLEHPYVRYVIQYVNTIKNPDAYVFSGRSTPRTSISKVRNKKTGEIRSYEYVREEYGFMSEQFAWKIIKFLNPEAYCHLFRDSLATRMAEKNYTEDQLMSWFDWSDPKVAHQYVQKGPRLIEEASRRTW